MATKRRRKSPLAQPTPPRVLRNYVGISRDHSGSMSGLARYAAKDYNSMLQSLKDNSRSFDQETLASVVECGINSGVRRDIVNANVHSMMPMPEYSYKTDGYTPLFDSVGELIEIFEAVPDREDPNVSFLIQVITDGQENHSSRWRDTLARKIVELQGTDHWTFTFRVPKGYAYHLTTLGIPAGNILEWEQTIEGLRRSEIHTTAALDSFYNARSLGATSSLRFYADMSGVSPTQVKSALRDISPEVSLWPVSEKDDGKFISTFVQERIKSGYFLKGSAFYQLVKSEKVQGNKLLAVRDKTSNAVYQGNEARGLLKISAQGMGDIKLVPANLGNFDVFIQSTSINRKLNKGTNLLYWPKVGQQF